MLTERGNDHLGNTNCPASSPGFQWTKRDLAARRPSIREGSPDPDQPLLQADIGSCQCRHLPPPQAGKGGEQHQDAEPTVVVAVRLATIRHLPQSTFSLSPRPVHLRRPSHHAVTGEPEPITTIWELPDITDSTTAHPISQIKYLGNRKHRPFGGVLLARAPNTARIRHQINSTASTRADLPGIRTVNFPLRPPRLRSDPVDGDGLCLLEQAHPDRPAFYAVRVPRCRDTPRASFPPRLTTTQLPPARS